MTNEELSQQIAALTTTVTEKFNEIDGRLDKLQAGQDDLVTKYDDLMGEIDEFFAQNLQQLRSAGLKKIILDVGIGFGKTPAANMHVMRRMDELISYDGAHYPLLLGASRKSFIGAALDLPVEERMEATGAACVLGILRGASIVRVHDVKPIVRMCRMTDAILRA